MRHPVNPCRSCYPVYFPLCSLSTDDYGRIKFVPKPVVCISSLPDVFRQPQRHFERIRAVVVVRRRESRGADRRAASSTPSRPGIAAARCGQVRSQAANPHLFVDVIVDRRGHDAGNLLTLRTRPRSLRRAVPDTGSPRRRTRAAETARTTPPRRPPSAASHGGPGRPRRRSHRLASIPSIT